MRQVVAIAVLGELLRKLAAIVVSLGFGRRCPHKLLRDGTLRILIVPCLCLEPWVLQSLFTAQALLRIFRR